MNDTILKLADVIDSLHATPEYLSVGVPMVRVVDVNNNFLRLDNCFLVDEETCDRHNKNHIPQKGDVIITRVGSYGMLAYVDFDNRFCLGQNIAIISPYKAEDGKFLYYYLKSPYIQNIIYGNSGGSSYKCIGLEIIKKLPLKIDGIEYRKIGDLLYQIDSKIENNRKINEEIDRMARTIYDYWFLQFDFPNGNGKPYKSSGGKMVWNEELKRKIPDGWKSVKLDKLCSFSNGINYDKNQNGDKDYRIINVRNISTSSLLLDYKTFDVINLLSKQAEKYIVGTNDILIARSGMPGAVRLLMSSEKDIIYCGFIIKCSPYEEQQRLYLTYSIKKLEGSNATKTGGSIMQNVSQDTLKNVDICLPPDNVIDKYNSIMEEIITKMQHVISENQELTSLRDFLLPLLMNGQVGFKEC